MSTQTREIGQGAIATLPNADPTKSADASKSLRRWLWNSFHDINLVGPDGLWIRLGTGRSYYGQGRPGETYEEYTERGGNLLRRCVAYPCDNIQYMETSTNLGKFMPAEQFNAGSGNDLGGAMAREEVTVYAGVCAADMVAQYGIAARTGGEDRGSYGMRDLAPLTGMTDVGTVAELIKIVQPYAYKLTNLQEEQRGVLEDEQTLLFDLADKGPAYERILGAKFDDPLRKIAEALRRMFLSGVRDATVKAKFDFFDLDKQLKNAALGKIGFKSMPSVYDEHVCFLLGEPVPSAVARPATGSDPDMKKAIGLLTDFVTGGQPAQNSAEEVAEMKSILSQMRGERTRLEKIKKELFDAGQLPGSSNPQE